MYGFKLFMERWFRNSGKNLERKVCEAIPLIIFFPVSFALFPRTVANSWQIPAQIGLDILFGKNRRTPSTIYIWICRSGYSITRQRILKSEIYGCITYRETRQEKQRRKDRL
jgi:hypothetical protein